MPALLAALGGGGGGGGRGSSSSFLTRLPPPLGWIFRSAQRMFAPSGGAGDAAAAATAAAAAAANAPTLAPFDASMLFRGGAGGEASDVLACTAPAAAPAPAPSAATDALSVVLVATLADLDHAALLLASLRTWLEAGDEAAGVRELIVLCPRADRLVWETALGGLRASLPALPLRVLTDDAMLRAPPAGGGAPGAWPGAAPGATARAYASQMVLKLLVARYASAAEFYLVLDADVLLAGPLRARGALLQGGRALFEPLWRGARADWWARAEALLDARGCVSAREEAIVMDSTPAVLSRTIAARAVCRLRRLYGDGGSGGRHGGWLRELFATGIAAGAERDWWSEFSLYHVAGHCSGAPDAWADGAPAEGLFARLHFAPPEGAGRRLLGSMTGSAAASTLGLRRDFSQWRSLAAEAFGEGAERGHLFVLLQSRAGIAVSRLAEVVAPFFGRAARAAKEAAKEQEG